MSTDPIIDPAQIQKRIAAQKEYCEKNKTPHFAPTSGVCWSCGKQIYSVHDGTSYVTGCPFCYRSYCE